MKKGKIVLSFSAAVLVIISLSACGSSKKSSLEQSAAAEPRTIQVSEEEYQLVLKENQYQYERELRMELNIPQDTDTEDFFTSEDNYAKALQEKAMGTLKRIKVQQELAAERGLAEPFKWKSFQEQRKAENTLREEKREETEVVYGVKSFGEAEFYMYQLDRTINLLKNAVFKEKGGALGEKEILEYYQEQAAPMMLENEKYVYTLCDVTPLYQEEKEPEAETVTAALAEELEDGVQEAAQFLEAGGQKYPLERRTTDQEELRSLVRSDLNGETLLELEPGEVSEVIRLEGKYLLVKYEGFQKAEVLTESDQDQIKGEILEAQYEAFIEEEAQHVVIEIKANK